ncbi:MAG TPA: transglycosylase family protein [Baekduia sp.]|jgi:hypothetical protein|nr:transglycosylase family protein [Baekduia sp.]
MLIGTVLIAGALAGAAAPASATPLSVDLPGPGAGLAPLVSVAKTPLVNRNVQLARKVAHVKREHLRRGYARAVQTFSVAKLARHHRRLRRELRDARRDARRKVRDARSTASPALQAIAACESGGNPRADTGNGFYGKYQFTMSTWQAVGGSGNPAAASEAEQDRRAATLLAQAGSGQWPVCGR